MDDDTGAGRRRFEREPPAHTYRSPPRASEPLALGEAINLSAGGACLALQTLRFRGRGRADPLDELRAAAPAGPGPARVVWASGSWAGRATASSGRTAARSAPGSAGRPGPERARVTTPAGSARGPARLRALGSALVALGALAASLGWLLAAPALGFAGRWALAAGLAIWAWRRRSLTTWILVSMVVGVSVGYDWPGTGAAMRVLSQIFIRMIKTIIAPLFFATLVVGIAGHPNLRHVGRMGVKALVYFEVVTTLALFIGLAAINLSQAGVGIQPPAGLESQGQRPPPQSLGRGDPARVSRERGQVRGRGPGAADRGLQPALRRGALALARRQAPADARVRRVAGGDDVQVHEPGDAVRADRRGRRDRVHGGPHGHRRSW